MTSQEYHRECTPIKVGRVLAKLKTPNLPGKGREQPTSRHHVTCRATKLLLGAMEAGGVLLVLGQAKEFFLSSCQELYHSSLLELGANRGFRTI